MGKKIVVNQKSKRGGARRGTGPKPKPVTKQKVTVSIYEETKEIMKNLGNGNVSEGVEIGARIYAEMTADKFFARAPVSEQCRLLLEMAQNDPDSIKSEESQRRIADVLEKIESLGIECAYEDAMTDGIIESKNNCCII
ncbi:MAG: hypothetical protein KME29_04635 [Calothrix sp. FI2-JRJ7]|jgi:hypothetical protein|nr:hypothetical protein [Calothrix sp. FI2-JRJ7]